jgi:uncharacterized protein YciI
MHDRGIRDQPAWDEHAQFFDRLVEEGIVILGGPVSCEGEDGDEVALLAVETADEHALRSTFDDDPWARSGILRLKEVRAWTIWLDGR